MDEEIKYEDLTRKQQRAVDSILSTYKRTLVSWPRKSGKTRVVEYIKQQLEKNEDHKYH